MYIANAVDRDHAGEMHVTRGGCFGSAAVVGNRARWAEAVGDEAKALQSGQRAQRLDVEIGEIRPQCRLAARDADVLNIAEERASQHGAKLRRRHFLLALLLPDEAHHAARIADVVDLIVQHARTNRREIAQDWGPRQVRCFPAEPEPHLGVQVRRPGRASLRPQGSPTHSAAAPRCRAAPPRSPETRRR